MLEVIAITLALSTLIIAFGKQDREKAPGIRRWVWLIVTVGLVEMILLPSWPQRLLLALVLIHTQLSFPPSAHERFLMQVCTIVGGYLLLLPYVQAGGTAYLEPFLWLLVGLGAITGVWAMVSAYYHRLRAKDWKGGMVYVLPWKVCGWEYWLWEGVTNDFTAGHMNSNFTQPVVMVSTTATLWLALQGSMLAWGLLPLVAFPIAAYAVIQHRPGQWTVHMGILACLVLASSFYGNWIWGMALLGLAGLIALAIHQYPKRQGDMWWDSGRFREWWGVMQLWWKCKSPLIVLIGGGIRSWLQASTDFGPRKANEKNDNRAPIFSMAHNEYLQQVFEYGVVGLVVLLWYVGMVLTKAHALSEGLFWVAVMLCSTAALSFPWSFYHTVYIEQPDPADANKVMVQETRHGSPLLVWLTFLLLVLVESQK